MTGRIASYGRYWQARLALCRNPLSIRRLGLAFSTGNVPNGLARFGNARRTGLVARHIAVGDR